MNISIREATEEEADGEEAQASTEAAGPSVTPPGGGEPSTAGPPGGGEPSTAEPSSGGEPTPAASSSATANLDMLDKGSTVSTGARTAKSHRLSFVPPPRRLTVKANAVVNEIGTVPCDVFSKASQEIFRLLERWATLFYVIRIEQQHLTTYAPPQ